MAHRRVSRAALVVAACTAGSVLAAVPAAADTAPLWVAVDSPQTTRYDNAEAIVVNPTNGTVNVTGFSDRPQPEIGQLRNFDYTTVAYTADSGRRVGRAFEASPASPGRGSSMDDFANDIAVDPTRGTVVITGSSDGSDATKVDYATVAYSRSGVRLWAARYAGPASGTDAAAAVAVDPVSGNVYVTGHSAGSGGNFADFATVAYSAGGAQLWVARYNHPDSANSSDFAKDVAVGPDGTVYITGSSTGSTAEERIVILAYSPGGDLAWVADYDTEGNDRPSALAVDPVTGTVYVAGFTGASPTTRARVLTVAYRPTGELEWVARYDGAPAHSTSAVGLAVVPGGNVYVTARLSSQNDRNSRYLTLGYSAAGDSLWADVYGTAGNAVNDAAGIAVDPGSGTVYVTGTSLQQQGSEDSRVATVAYSATGQRLRVDLFDTPEQDLAAAITVDRRSGNVYVAGRTTANEPNGFGDFLTIAYRGVS